MKTKRQLAAILFADIQGYTALMQKDEQTASQLLRHFQQQLEEKVSTFNGRIVNFYGDGALCTFQIPIDAVRCGMALQTTFNTTPKTPVRIGIHSGTVTLEGDKIFGDSVNITSRIESMGVAGGILVSKKVRDEVKNNPDLEMTSLGNFEFKNVEEPMEVFALANKGFAVPNSDKLQGKFKSTKPVTPSKWISVAAGIFALLVAGYFLFQHQQEGNRANTKETSIKKSIAVLPFKNWSGDENLEFFCDGMTDEVISRLTKISSFNKVVSRTSVFKYKNTKQAIPEIAKELDVTHILEGSFQKVGNQIKIKLQLIDALTDNHFWAEDFDGTWKSNDVFTIQADVAESVARNLELDITDSEMASIQKPPTQNEEAYNLFLTAEYEKSKSNATAFSIAIPLYEKAIALDANFNEPYLGLGLIYIQGGLVWGIYEEKEAWQKAKYYLEKAQKIDNDNKEAKALLVSGYFYYDWDFKKCEKIYIREKYDYFKNGFFVPYINYLEKTGRNKLVSAVIKELKSRDEVKPFKALLDISEISNLGGLGKKEEAIQKLNIAKESYQSDMYFLRSSIGIYFNLGEYQKAKNQLDRIKNQFTDRPSSLLWYEAFFAHIDGHNEISEQNIELLEQRYTQGTSGSPAWFLALYYFHTKNVDKGFEWLQKSYDRHEVEMTWLRVSPMLKPYRSDTRYQKLYKAMEWPYVNSR